METLISLIVVIMSQSICESKHHPVPLNILNIHHFYLSLTFSKEGETESIQHRCSKGMSEAVESAGMRGGLTAGPAEALKEGLSCAVSMGSGGRERRGRVGFGRGRGL